MSVPVPYQARGLSRQDQRHVARARARLDADTDHRISQIDAAADVEVTRVGGIARIGTSAMFEATKLSVVEEILAGVSTAAAGRVQALADGTTVALLNAVNDAGRKLR